MSQKHQIWQPIVAYGAYDTPTYTMDLTPFIPLLADGNSHVISLNVVSDERDHGVNPNWYLSGNLQVHVVIRLYQFVILR